MKKLRQLVLEASPDQREFLENLDVILLNEEFSGSNIKSLREDLQSALEEAWYEAEYLNKLREVKSELNAKWKSQKSPSQAFENGRKEGLSSAIAILVQAIEDRIG